MKKKKILFFLCLILLLIGNLSAESIGDTMKEFANVAASSGSGNAYAAISYDIFADNSISFFGHFDIIGPWGAEVGLSFANQLENIYVDINVASFSWYKYFSEKFFLSYGFGLPFGMNMIGDGEDFSFNPHIKLELNYMFNYDCGIMLYLRPGFKTGTNGGFSMPVGIGVRLPVGDVLSLI